MNNISLDGKRILVTGCPGFIGANLVLRLLAELSSGTVVSLDNMNDYYDPQLKEYRLGLIEKAAEGSPVEHETTRSSRSRREKSCRQRVQKARKNETVFCTRSASASRRSYKNRSHLGRAS